MTKAEELNVDYGGDSWKSFPTLSQRFLRAAAEIAMRIEKMSPKQVTELNLALASPPRSTSLVSDIELIVMWVRNL